MQAMTSKMSRERIVGIRFAFIAAPLAVIRLLAFVANRFDVVSVGV
jgi:hypothetical protein